jgi:hypothetical protein
MAKLSNILLASVAALCASTAAAGAAAPKVNLTLYSESLCPDCIYL